MGYKRKILERERLLLNFLIDKAVENVKSNWESNLLVSPMNDGQMGSLELLPNGIKNKDRVFGAQISECQFKDKDGTLVIASLYLDNFGELFELDIWKTDFSPLIEIPREFY